MFHGQVTQSAAYVVRFPMYAAGTRTPTPGLGGTLTALISKGGSGAWAAWGGTLTEDSGGFYYASLAVGDTGTLGELVLLVSGSGCDDREIAIQVLAAGSGGGPTAAQIATAVWQDTTAGDFAVAGSIGLSLFTGVAPGAASGVAIVGSNMGSVTSVSGSVGSVTGNVGGNVTGSVGSVVGAVGSVTGAVGSVTGNVGGNVTGSVGSVASVTNIVSGPITVTGGAAFADVVLINGVQAATTGAGSAVTFPTVGTVSVYAGGAVASVTGNVGGDVTGKVLGGGASAFTAVGVQADLQTWLGVAPLALSSQLVHATGSFTLDMTQTVPTTNTINTVGDALNAAIVQGFGKWVLDLVSATKTLTLYQADNTTVAKQFTLTLDANGNPIVRA